MNSRLWILWALILLQLTAVAQTSKFYKVFRDKDTDTRITGSVIYIVHMVSGDSLLLTEDPLKEGVYYRDDVDYGEYKVYIDGVKEDENILFGVEPIETDNIADGQIEERHIKAGNLVRSVNALKGDIVIAGGTNVTIASNGSDTITVSSVGAGGGGEGDISAVIAGAGLSGGGTSGDVSLYIGAEQISGTMIADDAIDTRMIATSAVGTNEISAITTADIPDGTIVEADIADNSITSAKVVNSSLTGSDIQDGSLTGSDIQDGSIGSFDITDESLTGDDIADDGIGASDLEDDAIVARHLSSNIIDSTHVIDGSISSLDIRNGSLTGDDIKNGSIGSFDIADESLTGNDIADDGIGASDLEDDAIVARHLSSNIIDNTHIIDSTITSADIAASSVAIAVNGLQDSVRIVAGANVTVTTAGDSITISSPGGGGGGDITAVTASTGLSGGGTSGDVSLSVAVSAGENIEILSAGGDTLEYSFKYPIYSLNDSKHGDHNVGWNPLYWRHMGLRIVDTVGGAWNDTLLGLGFDIVWDPVDKKYSLVAAAVNENDTSQVGLWTANDLLNWSEYGSNPILTPGTSGSWDDEGITFPQLKYFNNQWYMFYVGFASPGIEQGKSGIGIATAADLNGAWTRHPSNPIINPDDVSWVVTLAGASPRQLYKPELIKHKEIYYLFYNGGKYGTEEIGYSYSDSIAGPYTHSASPVITQAMTGYSQNADPDIHLVGDNYLMYFWGPSPKLYSCPYDSFPDGPWSSVGAPQFYPSAQVRPTVFKDGANVYCMTYDAGRKSINLYWNASMSDINEQIIGNWSLEASNRYWGSTDMGQTYIWTTQGSAFTKMEGGSLWLNRSYIRGRSSLLTGNIYVASTNGGGGGAYDLCMIREDNGDTLFSIHNQTVTSGRVHSFSKLFESNEIGTNTYVRIKARMNNTADRFFLKAYNFFWVAGGW